MADRDDQNRIRAPLPWLRHELRTPINQIIGYSEMLQEDAEDAGHKELSDDLGKITKAARMMLSLVNEHLVPYGEGDGEPAKPLQLGSEPKRGDELKRPSQQRRPRQRQATAPCLW